MGPRGKCTTEQRRGKFSVVDLFAVIEFQAKPQIIGAPAIGKESTDHRQCFGLGIVVSYEVARIQCPEFPVHAVSIRVGYTDLIEVT